MTARRLAGNVAVALVVAYWGLAVLGAVGNRSWPLLGVLFVPTAYFFAAGIVVRWRDRPRPAVVPAEHREEVTSG